MVDVHPLLLCLQREEMVAFLVQLRDIMIISSPRQILFDSVDSTIPQCYRLKNYLCTAGLAKFRWTFIADRCFVVVTSNIVSP